jgi:hypothetical protein
MIDKIKSSAAHALYAISNSLEIMFLLIAAIIFTNVGTLENVLSIAVFIITIVLKYDSVQKFLVYFMIGGYWTYYLEEDGESVPRFVKITWDFQTGELSLSGYINQEKAFFSKEFLFKMNGDNLKLIYMFQNCRPGDDFDGYTFLETSGLKLLSSVSTMKGKMIRNVEGEDIKQKMISFERISRSTFKKGV